MPLRVEGPQFRRKGQSPSLLPNSLLDSIRVTAKLRFPLSPLRPFSAVPSRRLPLAVLEEFHLLYVRDFLKIGNRRRHWAAPPFK